MQISFSPIRADGALSVSVAADVLTVNGLRLDLGALPDGGRLPAAAIPSASVASDVTRQGGVLRVALFLPHGEDAPAEVRFPAEVDLAQGPCLAPGLVDHDGPITDGLIDWDQLVTAEAAEAAAREAWRAGRVMAKLDLVLAMASLGMVSQQSAIAAAGGAIPAELEPLIAAMSDPPQTEVRIRWAGAPEIPRLAPFMLLVQDAMGLTDEQVDALFGWQ